MVDQAPVLTKEQKRALKAQRQVQRTRGQMPAVVDVACVLHGRAYDWCYVERLYNMIHRHLPAAVRFHVWTEHDRSVPPHMIKHVLEEWPGVTGPKKSWWYKLQMFDPKHHAGDLLYFDLDTIIVGDISWIVQESTEQLWILRDFRYLQNPRMIYNVNSSVMWWNTNDMSYVWREFEKRGVTDVVKTYHGDQDLINALVPPHRRQFLDQDRVASWRWQIFDGGWDFRSRRSRAPGTGVSVNDQVSVVVLHGNPKPHQIDNDWVRAHWC